MVGLRHVRIASSRYNENKHSKPGDAPFPPVCVDWWVSVTVGTLSNISRLCKREGAQNAHHVHFCLQSRKELRIDDTAFVMRGLGIMHRRSSRNGLVRPFSALTGGCCIRAHGNTSQSSMNNKQVVDHLLSPLIYIKV